MTDRNAVLKPREDAGQATAEDGVVILDGPDGVAVTMTADAAERTADSLHRAAQAARSNRPEATDAPADGAQEGQAT